MNKGKWRMEKWVGLEETTTTTTTGHYYKGRREEGDYIS